MLAGAYFQHTHDLEFIKSIWPQIDLALRWMHDYGDRDGDGFLEYARTSLKGLVQQGWKDSLDSVFHRDGTFAQGPIALCEVQGYAYAAKLAGAAIASSLGESTRSKALSEQAKILKENFQKSFWCDEISIYALALDGEKRQCGIRTSNAGHCLYAGIAGPEQARRVANTLMAAQSFSGWGVRTVATSVFLLLQAVLGMTIDGAALRVSFVRPILPEWLDEIQLKNLRVGHGSVDFLIQRHGGYATVKVQRREGEVEVFTES